MPRLGLGLGLGRNRTLTPFTPSSLPGLVYWGNVLDLAGTADGAQVTNMVQRVGPNLNTIGDAPDYPSGWPTYAADSGSGRPGLLCQWDGASHPIKSIRTSGQVSINTCSLFIVLRGTSFSSGMDNRPVGGFHDTASNSHREWFAGASNTFDNPLADLRTNGAGPECRGASLGGWAVDAATPIRSRIHHTGNTADTRAYKNDAQIGNAPASSGTSAVSMNFCLGCDVNRQCGFTGYFHEWLCYSPVLSGSDEALVEAYLAAAWQ